MRMTGFEPAKALSQLGLNQFRLTAPAHPRNYYMNMKLSLHYILVGCDSIKFRVSDLKFEITKDVVLP